MKKYSRLIALLLALLFLIGAASCSLGDNYEETTEPETASTSAPETTESITADVTEEPHISVVAPPDTAPPETIPPDADDVLHILIQDGKGEPILSSLANEEDRELLAKREERFLREHAAALKISRSADIVERIKNGILTDNNDFDLMLLSSSAGTELLTFGALEALSEAGIGITPESAGIHRSITESLTIGGSVYLLACDALVSDLTSVNAIKYDGTALSSDPVTRAGAGEFTVELLLTYISELKNDAFSFEQSSALALFKAVGGNVFVKNKNGTPLSALAEDKDFSKKYDLAYTLVKNDSQTNRDTVFTVTNMSSVANGSIYLPLPKADSDSDYISLVDSSGLSLIAAPIGVVDGHRLSKLLTALNLSSSDYREAVRSRLTAESGPRGEKMLSLIEKSACLDLGILLGWGDLDDYIVDGLTSGKSADELLSDRITSMRNEAVETAASIVAGRLGIE